ncbi:hypothetical protein [Planobispora takensis]|uniref:Uncharacterized protein n=1 Tax=Planobispora takensis TaxID=1367882 RepID=A0A8J3SZ25_9ACTN|nr:hypothetical protein [Planobispora takensis]GII03092.1 hypothetical protein Pta02_51000 [Planobispora takensis]
MTVNALPSPEPLEEITALREAQLQLDEVLVGFDPDDATAAERVRADGQLFIASVCAQLAQAEALQAIATTLNEVLAELRTLLRQRGGPS